MEAEKKIVELSLKMGDLLREGESLFASKRHELKVDDCFFLDDHFTKQSRVACIKTLREFRKQLALERSFYETFHNSFVTELDASCESWSLDDRNRFWERTFPRLYKNQSLRIRINAAKLQAVESLINLLKLMNSRSKHMKILGEEVVFSDDATNEEYRSLRQEIDDSLERQHALSKEQRGRL